MVINYLIVSLIAIGIFYELVSRSPEGYQDKDGFHYGKRVDEEKEIGRD